MSAYEDEACVEDCEVAVNPECAGNPKDKSSRLFDSAAICCSSMLGWINKDTCKSKSETGVTATVPATTGSGNWYVDWTQSQGKVCNVLLSRLASSYSATYSAVLAVYSVCSPIHRHSLHCHYY